jgi:hypothetical protein
MSNSIVPPGVEVALGAAAVPSVVLAYAFWATSHKFGGPLLVSNDRKRFFCVYDRWTTFHPVHHILGLPLAAAALARAAIEEALRRELEKTVDKKVIAEADLTKLINVYASKSLSKEGRTLANKVRIAGNNVLHQQGASSADALEAIEAARRVILELTSKTKPTKATKGG